MCIFTGPVRDVSRTKIFCRVGEKGNQIVVYSMKMEADGEVAMVLPIPVREDSDESAVKFLDFEKYPEFFEDLNDTFPPPLWNSTYSAGPWAPTESLKVHSVGSFDASFVPTIADFSRLDPRFRLPEGTWDKIPAYRKFGFAVFKLKAGRNEVHPMGFAFPTRLPKKIFFPTVHIHDGKVHATEKFDHSLYCQSRSAVVKKAWRESAGLAGSKVDLKRSHGVVLGQEHLYRKVIKGKQKNEDVVIEAI